VAAAAHSEGAQPVCAPLPATAWSEPRPAGPRPRHHRESPTSPGGAAEGGVRGLRWAATGLRDAGHDLQGGPVRHAASSRGRRCRSAPLEGPDVACAPPPARPYSLGGQPPSEFDYRMRRLLRPRLESHPVIRHNCCPPSPPPHGSRNHWSRRTPARNPFSLLNVPSVLIPSDWPHAAARYELLTCVLVAAYYIPLTVSSHSLHVPRFLLRPSVARGNRGHVTGVLLHCNRKQRRPLQC
jgi:hypothetical protein